MSLDPIDLIRRFEPILYFHQDERFFPSNAKLYLEHCALWRALGPPFDSKARWGGTSSRTFPHFPMVRRGKITASVDEVPLASEASDGVKGSFIGSAAFTVDTADEERFLDLIGWIGGAAVDDTSANAHANLDAIFNAYSGGRPSLTESRFWYHAEVFGAERLRGLLGPPHPAIDFEKFTKLKDPALVCYYLFFPGHEEPLEDCANSVGAQRWASCAGAWGCVAILLEGDTTQSNYVPAMIGLTSRNAGSIQFLGQELRVGMRVFDWNLATKVVRDRGAGRQAGEHARIFVSKGVHGMSLDQLVSPALTTFSPDDYSDDSCGIYETHAAGLAAIASEEEDRAVHDNIALVKIVAAAVGGFHGVGGFLNIGTGLLAAAGGAVGAMLTVMPEYGGMAKLARIEDGDPPLKPQFDHPPSPGQIGTVIHPLGVDPPDAPVGSRQTWPIFDANDDRVLAKNDSVGRRYSLWVADAGAPDSRPGWLPSEDKSQGVSSFKGRWGNRVVSDPFNRRAGMRFPEFWPMFFDGIGK